MTGFGRYTDQSRRAYVLAEDEARKLGHDGIGPEHFLLGILWMDEEPVTQWLAARGVTLVSVRNQIVEQAGRGEEPQHYLGLTRLGSQAMQVAYIECLRSPQERVDIDQLLLGVIGCEDNLAMDILMKLGVTPAKLRAILRLGVMNIASEVKRYLDQGDYECAAEHAAQMLDAAKEAVVSLREIQAYAELRRTNALSAQ